MDNYNTPKIISSSTTDDNYMESRSRRDSFRQHFLKSQKSPEKRTLKLADEKRRKRVSSSSSARSSDPVLVGDEHYVLLEWSTPEKKGKSGQRASHWRVRARQQERKTMKHSKSLEN